MWPVTSTQCSSPAESCHSVGLTMAVVQNSQILSYLPASSHSFFLMARNIFEARMRTTCICNQVLHPARMADGEEWKRTVLILLSQPGFITCLCSHTKKKAKRCHICLFSLDSPQQFNYAVSPLFCYVWPIFSPSASELNLQTLKHSGGVAEETLISFTDYYMPSNSVNPQFDPAFTTALGKD